jgi:uncharacterized protein (TIGR02453 family)
MRFRGWPPDALRWFEGLAANNTREWFQAHKATYDDCVREPFEALLEQVAPDFGEGKVFRPHRDVRFSPDKSPYKTYAAAVIERPAGGAWYVALNVNGLMAAAGYYHLARDQLQRYREAVADDRSGPELDTILRDLDRAELDIGSEDMLATAPRGYPRDHPRVELLRHRGMHVWRQFPPRKWLSTPAAASRVTGVWTTSRPLVEWLDRHVGASTEPPDRRP